MRSPAAGKSNPRPFVLDPIFSNAPVRPVAHRIVPTPFSDQPARVADCEFG